MNLPVNMRIATPEEVTELYQAHMSRDFPPNELKPLPLMLDLIQRGICSVWLCESEGRFVGYAVLAIGANPRFILLDYLAVDAAQRDQGWGSAILKALQERLKDCTLLIESEHPQNGKSEAERQKRTRRIAFYQRAGCQLFGVRSLLFSVDYDLLQLGNLLPPATAKREYLDLYRHMLPPEWLTDHLSVT